MGNTTAGITDSSLPELPETEPQHLSGESPTDWTPPVEAPKVAEVTRTQRDSEEYKALKEAERATKGWNKPGPKPGNYRAAAATQSPSTVGTKYSQTKADELLDALVLKLVAQENDGQYRSVWTHFFSFGGVYNGPTYIPELNTAIEYLKSKK